MARMNHLLEMDLPFDKIRIAHLARSLDRTERVVA